MTLLRQGRSFSGRERHCGFLNTGGGRRFADISEVSGLSLPEDGTGVAFCDWDQDGDLDLWMSNRSGPQVRFFRNEAKWPGRSLRLLLEGTKCNRDAIGARVTVMAMSGKPVTKTLRAGEGYLSQSSKWLHFGFGENEVKSVTVRWPGGDEEEFSGLKSGEAYRLKEGEGRAVSFSNPGVEPVSVIPEDLPESGRTNGIVLGIPLPLPLLKYESNAGESVELFDQPLGKRRGLLVNLWSAECEACLEELSELADARRQFEAAGLGVIVLNVDGLEGGKKASREAARRLNGMRFPFFSGNATESLVRFLQLTNDELLVAQRPLPVPTSFLIDQNWRLVAIYKGKVLPEQAISEMERLALPFEERRKGTLPFEGRWHFAPKNFVMLNFADRLFQRGFFEEGRDLVTRYARFMEPQPLFPGVLSNAGIRCLDAGRAHEAREYFQKALSLDPNRVMALHGLARVLSENLILEDQTEALKFARRAAEAGNFGNARVLSTLVQCLQANGEEQEAMTVLERALALPEARKNADLRDRLNALKSE